MASNTRELIQIDADEDVDSVRDRLSYFRGVRLLLVWPEEGTALTRKLDIVLIQREAMRRQIRLAFVTHDQDVIQYAAELNISTFETIGASERKRWKRGRVRTFTAREQTDGASKYDPPPEEEPAPRPTGIGTWLLRAVLVLLIIGVAFGAFYVIVPGATVRLAPARQTIEASVQITVNPDSDFNDVDVENAILPASTVRVEVEETASIPTSGQRDLGEVRAVGDVTFINETGQAIEIPAGTTLRTSAGEPINFRTTEPAVLPPGEGQEVDVPIEAMASSAGTVGNVDASMINTIVGPLEERADVINQNPTSEGQSRTEAVVTERDRERLATRVNQIIQERAFNEMQNLPSIGENQFLIDETVRIAEERDEWTRYSNEVGAVAETLTLTKRAVVEATVVDTALGQQIVFARLAQQIPRGRSFEPDTITYERGDVTFADDLILFTMSGQGTVSAQLNATQIASEIANMPIGDAVSHLSETVDTQDGTTPQVSVTPNLFGRLPLLPERIRVEMTG